MRHKSPSCAVTKIDPDRPALGIRYPWLELILRGIKTIEVRSKNTNIRGTIYLYASKTDVLNEQTRKLIQLYDINLPRLPRGLLVGEIQLRHSRPATAADAVAATLSGSQLQKQYAWELATPIRYAQPLPVKYLPYGTWFYPYRRQNQR